MAGPDDILCEALTELLVDHPRAVVTDPLNVRSLLAEHLSDQTPVDAAVLDAVVLAARTPVLRHLRDDARADITGAQLATELRKLGVSEKVANQASRAWMGALITDTPLVHAGRVVEPVPTAPSRIRVVALPEPPTRPAPRDAGAAPAPSPTVASPHPGANTPVPHIAEPVAVAGFIGGGARVQKPRRGWPRSARLITALLLIAGLAAGAAAYVGWTRDPSKTRANTAEAQVAELQANLGSSGSELTGAKAAIKDRDAQIASAKDQLAKMSTMARSQFTSARLPEQFTMSGKVAPGSCTLTGEACNVTPTLRSVKVACTTKPCDCTTPGCTVTSELWKTASTMSYDAATGLYTAKGALDGDVFRCGGVAQPTAYEFRFRVAKVNFDENVWKATGVDAELAETSSASPDCLAGTRTYALSSS